jgi:putative ABC transport system ATP-binding protein
MVDGTIEENLAFPFSFHLHKNKIFDPINAREWLDYFQLNIPLDHEALKLSIGQKQRIALIRSILLEPEVLLLDEPGSALDSNNKRLIEQKIESLINSSGIVVLMATHSEVSFSDSDYRSFRLEDGRLVECTAK